MDEFLLLVFLRSMYFRKLLIDDDLSILRCRLSTLFEGIDIIIFHGLTLDAWRREKSAERVPWSINGR